MLGGLVAGYTVRALRKYVPAKGVFSGFVSFWVYPVCSTLIVGIVIIFLLGKPVAWLNQLLIQVLGSMSGSNAGLLGAIIGVMVSFDLGGPVNKAAYTFCVGAMSEGILMPYAAFASIKMVSAFAVTFATLGFKKYFTKEEKEAGMSTWILGLAGIFSLFLLKDGLGGFANAAIWFFAAVLGAVISTILLILLKKAKFEKQQKA